MKRLSIAMLAVLMSAHMGYGMEKVSVEQTTYGMEKKKCICATKRGETWGQGGHKCSCVFLLRVFKDGKTLQEGKIILPKWCIGDSCPIPKDVKELMLKAIKKKKPNWFPLKIKSDL